MLGKPTFRRSNPVDSTPFEVLFDGSWHAIDEVRVKDGNLWFKITKIGCTLEEKVQGDNIRLRSRKATALDCERFLKIGVDVCVLSGHLIAAAPAKGQLPMFSWQDAKIISIKRFPHGERCTCLFSVVFNGGGGMRYERVSRHCKRAQVVKLDNISVLQRLKFELSDDGSHEWNLSEDSIATVKSKLLTGEFSSEVSWLVVLSLLKGMEFAIKVLNNRIVHHIIHSSQGLHRMADDKKVAIMGFNKRSEKWRPKFEKVASLVPEGTAHADKAVQIVPLDCTPGSDSEVEILYACASLRRSKRQKVTPDRFVPIFSQPGTQEITTIDSSENEVYEDDSSCCEIDHPSSWSGPRTKKKKLLSASECKEMIKNYMGTIQSAMEKDMNFLITRKIEKEIQPPVEHVEFRPINTDAEVEDFKWTSDDDDIQNKNDEHDEHEELWKEMEHALMSLAILEQKQDLSSEFCNRTTDISNEDTVKECQHEYKLDEQIGLVCCICEFIFTEIRYVSPQFVQNDRFFSFKEKDNKQVFDWLVPYNLGSEYHCSGDRPSMDIMSSLVFDDVWNLIPEYASELHLHQKRAFEFIWRNIGGGLTPQDINNPAKETGGCVISHSPGSGKTLLVISFLVSYLKLHPQCRPLVLAPKIAMYTWCKEFEKWGVSAPIFQILPVESFKKGSANCKFAEFTDKRRPSKKMMHAMDCLLKLRQWHDQPSILLLSYPSFMTLIQEDSKLEYRRFMAAVLQRSPGILILDEGHNPRSTISKLRRQLMKVKTEYRIMLSGTLFQNNFEEYFNSLALARPRFIRDVAQELGPDMADIINSSRRQNQAKKTSKLERQARKVFLEQVGLKIESSFERDREIGFNLLNRLTSGFVDVYEGETLDMLPGLQIYTLLLTSTDIQREILLKVARIHRSFKHKRCPLELECLTTVGSIHPWLIKEVACVHRFFSEDELENIEKYKDNFRSGSKVKFIVDLVHKCTIRAEKVLIFCHNIPPINMLVKVLETLFAWRKEKEILVLQGDQEMSVREKVMDKFNGDVKGTCKVLIASTTASAEGISLTAASRVVLVDSEWNHSKTRQAIARAFRPGQEKVVYVYRLLASGTWEEDKYDTNAWKAWLSKMVFLGGYIRYPSSREVEDIDDEVLRELVEEDQKKTFQMVMKHD